MAVERLGCLIHQFSATSMVRECLTFKVKFYQIDRLFAVLELRLCRLYLIHCKTSQFLGRVAIAQWPVDGTGRFPRSFCRSVGQSVCLSVCPLVTNVHFGRTAEAIELPFGMVSGVDARNLVLNERAHWLHLANTVERL